MPVIHSLIELYQLWHQYRRRMDKAARYTLGERIDTLLLETMELTFQASATPKQLKAGLLYQAGAKINLVKLFLRLAWEIKALDDAKFTNLSERLDGAGRMVGGWIKQTQTETPRH